MTKEERDQFNAHTDSGLGKHAAHLYKAEIRIGADIAYQLTIANEQRRHESRRLHAILESVVELCDPKPAPDAGLVDLLRETQSYIRTTLPKWAKAEDLPPIMHKLAKALAAHKPEVGQCPYCDTELVKRDTYGYSGDEIQPDESFDWCPDCERVIEGGERMEAGDGS